MTDHTFVSNVAELMFLLINENHKPPISSTMKGQYEDRFEKAIGKVRDSLIDNGVEIRYDALYWVYLDVPPPKPEPPRRDVITLKQSIKDDNREADDQLASLLNDGYRILSMDVVNTNKSQIQRIVTLIDER